MALKSKSLDLVRPDVPVKAVTAGKPIRFNIILDESQHHAWKTEALARRTTVADMVREAMAQYLKK